MIIIVLVLFLLDRIIKYYLVTSGGDYLINEGIALGILNENAQLIFILHLFFTSLLAFYILIKKVKFIEKLVISGIVVGSISNLMDRVVYNGVVDYVKLWNLPVFNIGDSMVVVGVVSWILLELYENYKKFNTGN